MPVQLSYDSITKTKSMGRLQKEAFWLYGVIVGLAVREALSRTVAHFIFQSNLPSWAIHLEEGRLLVFIALIVRFYLGAAIFFDFVYDNPQTAQTIQTKNYSLDYIMGFLHFLMFFAWSTTIPVHERLALGMSHYLWFLVIIVLYDLPWFLANWKYDTAQHIRIWTFYNTITFLLFGFVFLGVRMISHNSVLAEEFVFPIVLIISSIDILELTQGKHYMRDLAAQLLTDDTDPGVGV